MEKITLSMKNLGCKAPTEEVSFVASSKGNPPPVGLSFVGADPPVGVDPLTRLLFSVPRQSSRVSGCVLLAVVVLSLRR